MDKEAEVQRLDTEIAKLESQVREINAQINQLYAQKVALLCPYKPGDILQERRGGLRIGRVLRVLPRYSSWTLECERIKKDRTIGGKFCLYGYAYSSDDYLARLDDFEVKE